MTPLIENSEQDRAKITAPNSERLWPEFIPLPSVGSICAFSGCTRAFLNTLVLPTVENDFKPPVKSVSIRKRGSLKGKRLIVADSLRKFLWKHVDDGSVAREKYELQSNKIHKNGHNI